MALKERGMVENALGTTALSLTAQAGESLLVRGIACYGPAKTYATVQVDRTTVGYFRIGGTQGNHLFFPADGEFRSNLFSELVARNLHRGFPVPEGMTFSISGVAVALAAQAVLYDVYDAADMRPDAPNGPAAHDYDFVNYGRMAAALVDGDNLYTTPANPAEFPDFPFGAVAPAGHVVDLFGVAFTPIGETDTSQANQQGCRYLKMIRERTVLFDADRNGLLVERPGSTSADQTDVGGGYSVIGGHSSVDNATFLEFDAPIRFDSNEELGVYLNAPVIAGAANLTAEMTEIALIQRVSRR